MDGRDVVFINVSHPSQLRQRDTMQAVRRRVMRDIGKSRRRRPRAITVAIDIPASDCLPEDMEISRTLQPYGYFAVQPNARARQLFHFMHGPAGPAYRPFRMEWFAMAVADQCAFYLCLANAALFYHQMTGGEGGCEYSDCDESARYFSLCMGMMTERLGSGSDAVSEGVVTTVLGFLCHDAAVAKWDRWSIHMDGLERILQLRHCFPGLSDLNCVMSFWFDLTGSAMHDTAPRFNIPSGMVQQSLPGCEMSSTLTTVLSSLATTGDPPLVLLCRALGQTALVADFINKNAHDPRFWDGGIDTTRVLGPAAHYVLSIPRMTAKSQTCGCARAAEVLCEMARLALLILIARLKSAFSLVGGEMAAFQEKFAGILPLLVHETFDVCPDLALWSLVVVACSHAGVRPQSLTTTIRECMARLRVGRARDAVEVARSIIWVDLILASEAEGLVLELQLRES
ncbi:hypothetical protein GE09DRAFT_206157 [Coniochaeta sp. 2T2.1]|nr:hypothetical protein GE09DRAFT_206157 [Coniochaeta sp. 2T2.1]